MLYKALPLLSRPVLQNIHDKPPGSFAAVGHDSTSQGAWDTSQTHCDTPGSWALSRFHTEGEVSRGWTPVSRPAEICLRPRSPNSGKEKKIHAGNPGTSPWT